MRNYGKRQNKQKKYLLWHNCKAEMSTVQQRKRIMSHNCFMTFMQIRRKISLLGREYNEKILIHFNRDQTEAEITQPY